jgi:tellurite methyltransferase
MANRSIDFFEEQFQRQVRAHEFSLNPFEEAALPYLSGRVLDLACGLGNLSLAAARKGCEVVAVDASPTAIEHLSNAAREEKLNLTAVRADIEPYEPAGTFDTVVAIGILMFFPRETALALLERVMRAVRPGGRAVVTVLIRGTTFMEMFEGDRYYLFTLDELEHAFAGWTILSSRREEFPAPNGQVKRFSTLIAEKPS